MHRRNHVKQKTIGVDTSANIRLCKSRRKLPRHAVSLIFPCDIMWEVSDHNVYMFQNTYWQLFLYRYMTWYSPSMVTNCNNNLIKKIIIAKHLIFLGLFFAVFPHVVIYLSRCVLERSVQRVKDEQFVLKWKTSSNWKIIVVCTPYVFPVRLKALSAILSSVSSY